MSSVLILLFTIVTLLSIFSLLNWFLNYRIYLLLIAALLMVASYKVSDLNSSRELNQAATSLSQRINTVTRQIESSFTDQYFLNNLSQKKLVKEEVERLNRLSYEILLY